MLKSLPYELRFRSEHCTDRYEGEEPVGLITKKPLLSLLRRARDTSSFNLKLPLKTEVGIFEHCTHQRRLRAHGSEAGRAEELLMMSEEKAANFVTGCLWGYAAFSTIPLPHAQPHPGFPDRRPGRPKPQ